MRKLMILAILGGFAFVGTACSPEVGSEAWCKKMEKKPRGDWTMSELQDYTKYCVLKEKRE
ncbi:MAG TPA: DUF3012 domain-containing protein [Mariprofundaceae bacterium]|nr:DUF3012 domain-containing protein [Mariprofundaceae bacterium]